MIKVINRCTWPSNDALMIEYHDNEWGVPVHNDQKLFEFIVLDAFQAGLSWKTILHKRENFRDAFHNFDIQRVASMGEDDFEHLMQNAGIIRNRAKIQATFGNARAFLKIQQEFGSFDKYIWQFVDNKPIVHSIKMQNEACDYIVKTKESDEMSKALIKRGFKFVGSTICYAFMQAAGLVNDHFIDCYRYKEVQKLK